MKEPVTKELLKSARATIPTGKLLSPFVDDEKNCWNVSEKLRGLANGGLILSGVGLVNKNSTRKIRPKSWRHDDAFNSKA